jgi:hypothetical protein
VLGLIIHLPDATHYQAIADGVCTADTRSLGSLPLKPGDALIYYEGHPGHETGRHVHATVTFVQPQGEDGTTFFCFQLRSQLSSISIPPSNPHHQLTVFSLPDDDDYPGMAIKVDGECAAVVEWHPTYQTLVIRTYRAEAEDPHRYYRWDTGAPLPLDT